MHGDPNLPITAPRTHRFLSRFQDDLEKRASYRRYQKGQPYWSTWSTGPYSFSPFKVLWKEMSGSRFAAAYMGPFTNSIWNQRVVVPDHKLYFVAVDTEDEAAYLTGLLNAPTVAGAISAYAAQLSLGTSAVEYLNIPAFDPIDVNHQQLARVCKEITARGGTLQAAEMDALEQAAAVVFGIRG